MNIFFTSLFGTKKCVIGVPLSLWPLEDFVFLSLCSISPFLPLPIIQKRHISSIRNKSRASPVNYTHMDNGGFWGRGFEYRPASFASRRVPQHPGPRIPVVHVCQNAKLWWSLIGGGRLRELIPNWVKIFPH